MIRVSARRDREARVMERSEELAEKQTGREFMDLTSEERYRIWSLAEDEVIQNEVSAAEYARERDR
jgi:hypothetical protein